MAARILRLGLVALLTFCALPARGALEAAPFEARFEMHARGFVIASIRWRLERREAGFAFESVSEAAGVAAMLSENRIVERSEWSIVDGQERPIHYRYERSGRKNRSVKMDFDWAKGRVNTVIDGEHSGYAIEAGTLDKLSYLLAVIRDLAAGVKQMRYPVATPRALRQYVIETGSRERTDTALGELETLRVSRVRDDDDRQTELWLAPTLGFIPVRIEHRERDGEELSIRIVELRR